MIAMTPRAITSYVLCGTPRSGSTLLCEILGATGVAGRPNSYFRREDIAYWADAWGVLHPEGIAGPGFNSDYLAAMRREGSAGTGVFGLRLMWDSATEASRRLSSALAMDQDLALSLEAAFGPTLYVHLSRDDKVAQAISRSRAEQSGVWHLAADGTLLEGTVSAGPISYDGERIAELVKELHSDEAAWNAFFEERRINPLRLVYEAMTADPHSAVESILLALGLDPEPARRTPIRTARIADKESALWRERFKQENSTFVLREATLEDVPQLLPLLAQVQALHAEAYPEVFRADTDPRELEADLRSRLAREGATGLMAVAQDGAAVGYAIWEVESRERSPFKHGHKRGHLHQIVVDAAWRGRGVGTSLMAEAKVRLRSEGVEQIVASYYAFNAASAALMQRAGLVPLYVMVEGKA